MRQPSHPGPETPAALLSLPLILLLVYAAAAKLLDMDAFHRQLLHQPIPIIIAHILWPTLPAVELLAAGLLLRPKTRAMGLWLSFALLFLFSGYVALAWLHWWSRTACSCGGILGHLSWGWHLLFNLAFLAINVAAVTCIQKTKESESG